LTAGVLFFSAGNQREARRTARARAFAVSSSLFFGTVVDLSESKRLADILLISSTAEKKTASFAFDGLLKPLIFLTNCSDAAPISASVTGGWKLNKVLMLLHIALP